MRLKKNKKYLSDEPLVFLALILIVLVNANLHFNWSSAADRYWYDQQMALRTTDADSDIVIIEIDDQSLSLIGDWPWDRAYHAELINLLTAADARLIAYNLVFSANNLPLNASDYLLADAIERNGRVVLPVYFGQVFNNGPLEEILPPKEFSDHALLGHVNVYLDDDGVYRSVRLSDQLNGDSRPHFSLAALSLIDSQAIKNHLSFDQTYISFISRGSDFKRYSFVDVLAGEVDFAAFYQKTVFVGVTATSIGDPLITPVIDRSQQMAAVDINANIYQMLNRGDNIQRLPLWLNYTFNTLIILLVVLVVPRLSIRNQLLSILLMSVVVLAISWLVLQVNYWFPIAAVVVALLIIPVAWNALRLSRLFRYFIYEAKRLESQQRQEHFHFPEQLILTSIHQLEKLLALLAIDSYQLETSDDSVAQLSEQDATIEKRLPVVIAEKKYILTIRFLEYGQQQKHQLQLLRRLLEIPAENKALWNEDRSSDIFSRQLYLIQIFQEHLASSQHLFESSIQELASAVLVADLNGSVLFRNTLASKILNPAEGNLFDQLQVCQLIRHGNWLDIFAQAILQQRAITVEAKSDRYDLSVSVRCLEDKTTRSPLLVVSMSDISLVKQAQRSRNEMIDFISHDMRSPMASLQALVRQLEHNPQSLSASELLQKVDQHSQRALNFAEEFLSLAKVESEDSIQTYEVDMYSVSQNAMDTLYEQAQAKRIDIELEADDDCWTEGNGDMLERVMLNLLSNAIKYSPAQTKVQVQLKHHADWLDIAVRDQGEGIAPELLPRLFKSFQRGVGGRAATSKGLGLGLRFVDVALQRHDSQIQVTSDQSGSCFYFRLKRMSD